MSRTVITWAVVAAAVLFLARRAHASGEGLGGSGGGGW